MTRSLSKQMSKAQMMFDAKSAIRQEEHNVKMTRVKIFGGMFIVSLLAFIAIILF